MQNDKTQETVIATAHTSSDTREKEPETTVSEFEKPRIVDGKADEEDWETDEDEPFEEGNPRGRITKPVTGIKPIKK